MLKIDISSAPLAIQIASCLIIVAVLFTLIAYALMLVFRFRSYARQRKEASILPLIDNLLSEQIFAHPEMNHDIPAVNVAPIVDQFKIPELEPKWAKEVMIDRFIAYRKNIRGNMGKIIRLIFLNLELDRICLKMLRSSKWYKKAKALRIFVEMDIPVADATLLPLTNSRNHLLRSAARLAYVKLSKNEPFKFFDVVTEPLLQWDQVELFRIITTAEDIAIPNFARWVTYSSNKSVISFCLKLIEHYNQIEAAQAVISLLDNRDHFLRANAIDTLGKLEIDEVGDRLMHMYHHQPINCQVAILKALGRFKKREAADFLKREFLYSNDFDVRKNAARSLINMLSKQDPLIQELMDNATRENLMILKHCMDPLITR